MAAIATGSVCQPGLVERRHLDQLGKFDPLHQELGNAVTTPYRNWLLGVEIDQRHLDLSTVPGIDRPGTVHDRQADAAGQTRTRMDQSDHSVRNGDGDPGRHQGPVAGRQVHIDGTEQVHTCIAVVGPAGQR